MILRAYPTRENPPPIVPAPRHRDWLDALPKGHANRCLPLSIGNQYGWQLLCERNVRFEWDGGDDPADLQVDGGELAQSHFGYGVLTFYTGYMFRTPPGWDLFVTGPANCIKNGLHPLQAVVETDWGGHTFTFNWKLSSPTWPYWFKAGEPFCQFWPVKRGALEQWRGVIETAPENVAIQRAMWAESRVEHLARDDGDWQKGYYKGDGGPKDHQMRLHLREFEHDH